MTDCEDSVSTSRTLHGTFIAAVALAEMIPSGTDAVPPRKGST